jgi:leucyl/phenylalanyl-tRNA--protein transferase
VPVYRLDERLVFPPPELGPRRGPIAVGGDLRPARLLLAYSMGIFPWEGEPLHWHSPDPRMVLLASELRVTRSLEKTIRRGAYRLTLDTAFTEVMVACASVPRPGQEGTWITPDMVDSYTELHRRGVAHSVEAWEGDELVGGLYGLSLGTVFFGESMFARARDASKVAFVRLVRQLEAWGISLIDCQVYTPHLASFGAREWPRRAFLQALRPALEKPSRLGPWRFDEADAFPLSAPRSEPVAGGKRNRAAGGSRGPGAGR